ncbi:MAG: formate dehydrogenase accessory protein FdhE [Bacillus sp. (in: Bacteria)]|nr:formate dehydrogenase accessory protein FdhE [Bacillus sp. (in: firmicutes)]
MSPNVVSEEYLALQKGIMEEQNKLKEKLMEELKVEINKEELDLSVPVLPQLTSTPVTPPLYHEAVVAISTYLHENSGQINEQLLVTVKNLTENQLLEWIKASITFDAEYFQQFAEENELEPWLPHFVAEQAIRPFLHVVSSKCTALLHEVKVMGTCPCCGEPSRLGKLTSKGEKFLYCPRCESEWKHKRLQCVHCGNDKHDNLFYLGVEEDEMTKIEVCKSCRNYLKLIDMKKTFAKKQAALWDLETLHLDFIAQEEGFGEESS